MDASEDPAVALTDRLGGWLKAADCVNEPMRTDIAVGLADVLAAARRVQSGVEALLAVDPRNAADADRALSIAAELEAYLFGEMRSHLESLENA